MIAQIQGSSHLPRCLPKHLSFYYILFRSWLVCLNFDDFLLLWLQLFMFQQVCLILSKFKIWTILEHTSFTSELFRNVSKKILTCFIFNSNWSQLFLSENLRGASSVTYPRFLLFSEYSWNLGLNVYWISCCLDNVAARCFIKALVATSSFETYCWRWWLMMIDEWFHPLFLYSLLVLNLSQWLGKWTESKPRMGSIICLYRFWKIKWI